MVDRTKIFKPLMGGLMTLAGLYMWFHPMDTLVFISLYFGIIFILVGIAYGLEFLSKKMGIYIAYTIIDIVIGVVLITNSTLVATSLSVIFGLWILFSSVIQIASSIEYKRLNISFWIYPFLIGILGTIFSFLILHNPAAGIVTITVIIGAYLVLYGLTEIFEYFLVKESK